MELKTLKDLEAGKYSFKGLVRLDHLREEAIKRAKSNNTAGFSFDIGINGKVMKWNKKKEKLNSIDYVNLGAMVELIEFFNLTNEDLR